MNFTKTTLVILTTLAFAFNALALEEKDVDFRVDQTLLERGEDQIAIEWQSPDQFRSTEISITDLVRVNKLNPSKLQMINAKTAMISNRPMNDFSVKNLATAKMVKDMLRSVSTTQKSSNVFDVTNKVKAYGLPFKVSFTLELKETTPSAAVRSYFTSQAAGFAGTGRESFMTLNMTNFSQLMYQNYSVIYTKELANGKTLIIATIMAGFDLPKANSYFNYPPFARTDNTMIGNFRSQTEHMLKSMKN